MGSNGVETMKFLAAMMFLWAIIHASFNTDMWRGWRWFCRIVGHRWYFVISTPTLERREQFCIRCGIIGHWEPAPPSGQKGEE